MPTIQGLVDPDGAILRMEGTFSVVSKSPTQLVIRIPGEDLGKAFVLSTPWREGWDIAAVGIAASPGRHDPELMLFAVDGYYGVSFLIQT